MNGPWGEPAAGGAYGQGHGVEVEYAVQVQGEPQVAEARRLARQVAEEACLGPTAAYYLATCASELSTNLVVHAGGGELRVRRLRRADGVAGVELCAEDRGPGIPDPARALTDGYSTAGGLGGGLPGVGRLSHELHIGLRPGGGARVVARRWATG